MNFKTTIALFLLLALVGGYFYFVEYGNISGHEAHQLQRDAEANQTVGEPVFTDGAPDADTLHQLAITRGTREFEAQKSNNQWFQTQPVRFALDAYAPDAVARAFANLRYIQSIEPAKDDNDPDTPTIAQLGLDNPRAIVTVKDDDNSWTIKLGRLAVDGHGYVQVEGKDTVYVVNPTLHGTVLDQPTNDWRSKSLGTFNAQTSDRLTLKQLGNTPINLHKVDGRWTFDSKSVQRTSNEAIDELFNAVSRTWITAFVEDNPEDLRSYGLDQPHLELIIQTPAIASPSQTETDVSPTGKPITHRLKIGRTDLDGKSRYATWATDSEPTLVVFTLDSAAAESLARTPDALRDPNVIVASAQDVRELTVTQNDAVTLHILRDPQSGYRFGEPTPAFGIDYSTTHALVKQLCELQSTTYTTSLTELGKPTARLTLTVASDTAPINLAIYQTADNHTLVTDGEGVGYVIDAPTLLSQLLGPPLGLRKRNVLDITPEQITKAILTRPDGVTYTFQPNDADTGWSLLNHESFEDTTLIALLSGLNPLRAEGWLDKPLTPSADWLNLTVHLTDESTASVSVDPASRNASTPNTDNGFILPQKMVDLLNAEYRDRSLHMPSVDQLATIKLSSGEIAITLSRDGQAFTSDHGETDQALAASTFDTLAGLRAARYTAPLNVRPEDIDFTLEATTHNGEKLTLHVLTGDTPNLITATLDPAPGADHTAWFTLNKTDIDALRAALTDIETPTK